MEFFVHNWLAAAGAAGASIPVIIHLLNKQRYKRVTWGAMHWLWASFRKSRRRMQVEQLILLIIRTLIVLLLALALARPIFQALSAFNAGRSAMHRVIVIDNSYSMGQDENGTTLFEKAKTLAGELAGQMSGNDELDILLTGDGFSDDDKEERIVSSRDALNKGTIADKIKAAQLGDGGTDMPRAIAAACRVLNEKQSKALRREIVIITDRTRNGWMVPNQPQQARRVVDTDDATIAEAMSNVGAKPKIVVMRLSSSSKTDNFAASGIEIDEKVLPVGVDNQFIGTVHSFAAGPASNLNVKLKVDALDVETAPDMDSAQIPTISKGKPESVALRYAFSNPGSHAVAIKLDSEDSLKHDDTAYLAVDVVEQARVLCVDGNLQPDKPNGSALDFFRQALSPTKGEEVNAGKMPLFPEVISEGAFPKSNLDNYRLVVLANVSATIMPDEDIQALIQYVKQGGSLLIFCGDRVDSVIYNKLLGELMPMELGKMVQTSNAEGLRESLSDKDIDHPAIAKFMSIKGFSLAPMQTFKRLEFIPKEPVEKKDPNKDAKDEKESKEKGGVRVVLKYDNGEVAAVEERLGAGRVIVFGTSADKSWNNWPGIREYMPLMNFVALDLVSPPYLQRNKLVGDHFSLQIQSQDMKAVKANQGLTLIDPAGRPLKMDYDSDTFIAKGPRLKKAGIYTAEMPGDVKRTLHFAVNRKMEESDLTAIDDRDILAKIAVKPSDDVAATGFFGSIMQGDLTLTGGDVKDYEQSVAGGKKNKDLWRWFAVAVLLLLVAESILARRFGQFKR